MSNQTQTLVLSRQLLRQGISVKKETLINSFLGVITRGFMVSRFLVSVALAKLN